MPEPKKRPSARRVPQPLSRPTTIPPPAPEKKSWMQMNQLCGGFLGSDARQIAMGTVIEDIEAGALKLLPPQAVMAVATLLGSPQDKNAVLVARAVVEVVRSRPS